MGMSLPLPRRARWSLDAALGRAHDRRALRDQHAGRGEPAPSLTPVGARAAPGASRARSRSPRRPTSLAGRGRPRPRATALAAPAPTRRGPTPSRRRGRAPREHPFCLVARALRRSPASARSRSRSSGSGCSTWPCARPRSPSARCWRSTSSAPRPAACSARGCAPRLRRPLRVFLLCQCAPARVAGLAVLALVACPPTTPGLAWFDEYWRSGAVFRLGRHVATPGSSPASTSRCRSLLFGAARPSSWGSRSRRSSAPSTTTLRTAGARWASLQAANIAGCVAGQPRASASPALTWLGTSGSLRLLLVAGVVLRRSWAFAAYGTRSAFAPLAVLRSSWSPPRCPGATGSGCRLHGRPRSVAGDRRPRTPPASGRSCRGPTAGTWSRSTASTTAGFPSAASTRGSGRSRRSSTPSPRGCRHHRPRLGRHRLGRPLPARDAVAHRLRDRGAATRAC